MKEYVKSTILRRGYSPSMEEIKRKFPRARTGDIQEDFRNLARKGELLEAVIGKTFEKKGSASHSQ